MALTDLEQRRRQFFAQRFCEALDAWKQRTGESQEKFADRIDVKSKNSITNYRNGKNYPDRKAMRKICEVFGVDELYFYPSRVDLTDTDNLAQTIQDNQLYSSDYHARIDDEFERIIKKAGLDKNLLQFIMNHPDVAKLLTCKGEWCCDRNLPKTGSPYMVSLDDGFNEYIHPVFIPKLRELQDLLLQIITFYIWKWKTNNELPADKDVLFDGFAEEEVQYACRQMDKAYGLQPNPNSTEEENNGKHH